VEVYNGWAREPVARAFNGAVEQRFGQWFSFLPSMSRGSFVTVSESMRTLAWLELLFLWSIWWAAYFWRAPKFQKRKSVTAAGATRLGLLGEVAGLFLIFLFRADGAPRTAPAFLAAAALLAVAADVLMWKAVAHLGRQFRISAGLYEDHQLVRTGPYKLVRHPIYTSFLSITLATGLLLTRWAWLAISLVLFIAGTEIRVRTEDRLLSSRFGAEFADYKGKVAAAYLPLVR
jgi:protein-S-isoprenylcysteine O-methyltransferase Ste14